MLEDQLAFGKLPVQHVVQELLSLTLLLESFAGGEGPELWNLHQEIYLFLGNSALVHIKHELKLSELHLQADDVGHCDCLVGQVFVVFRLAV